MDFVSKSAEDIKNAMKAKDKSCLGDFKKHKDFFLLSKDIEKKDFR